jgi:hypothetical protein
LFAEGAGIGRSRKAGPAHRQGFVRFVAFQTAHIPEHAPPMRVVFQVIVGVLAANMARLICVNAASVNAARQP